MILGVIETSCAKSYIVYSFQFYKSQKKQLTYCGLVMPYGDIDLGQHWLT